MKLLFDQNISFRITNKLQEYYVECKHVSDCGLMNCDDNEIWQYAKKNNYSIVTFDSDFYEISMLNGHPPKIIWLRSGNLTTLEVSQMMIKNHKPIHAFLENNEFENLACLEIEM